MPERSLTTMTYKHFLTPGALLAILLALAGARLTALSAQSAFGASTAGTRRLSDTTVSTAALFRTWREDLVARFGAARTRAVAKGAGRKDRSELVHFVRTEMLPYLHGEGIVIYPTADSIGGIGGYATIAALLDGEG